MAVLKGRYFQRKKCNQGVHYSFNFRDSAVLSSLVVKAHGNASCVSEESCGG